MAPRVVFDTNVFVSAYAFGGKPRELMLAATAGDIELVTSPAILAELARVLADKFAVDTDRVEKVIGEVVRVAEIMRPGERVAIIADEPDNRALECAREGGAEWIFSGDAHLIELREFEGVAVLSVAEAVERLAS